jgi:hypothetical protein
MKLSPPSYLMSDMFSRYSFNDGPRPGYASFALRLLSSLVLFLGMSFALFTRSSYASEVFVLENEQIRVLFERPLGLAARKVNEMYSPIKEDLQQIFGWNIGFRPSVLLIRDTQYFQRIAESPLTVAFAVPAKRMIAMDYSRINTQPFSMEITLKHELCHLLLHDRIGTVTLPRWLDEGVCQWVSGGIPDIILDQKRSALNRAAFRGTFIPLDSLRSAFPRHGEDFLLAYEESKGFTDYIISRFGKKGLLSMLEMMRTGKDAPAAALSAFSITLSALEKDWHGSLQRKTTWLTYLSYHLYEILFGLTALIAACAFIRTLLRKRARMDEESHEEDPQDIQLGRGPVD